MTARRCESAYEFPNEFVWFIRKFWSDEALIIVVPALIYCFRGMKIINDIYIAFEQR